MKQRSANDLAGQISKARAGCSEALGDLLEMYRNYLGLLAQVQIGAPMRRKFSQSDVVQATFAQAHRFFGEFRGTTEGELVAWLRKILVTQLTTEFRRYGAQRRNVALEEQLHQQVNESSVQCAALFVDRRGSPSGSAMRREGAVLLAEALSQLPEDHREVIVMRHLKGHAFTEIASTMDCSIDRVKGIWRRAIAKLKVILDDAAV